MKNMYNDNYADDNYAHACTMHIVSGNKYFKDKRVNKHLD